MKKPMYTIACILFSLGIIAYVVALSFMGSVMSEISSDIGNAIMHVTAVLLLLALTRKIKKFIKQFELTFLSQEYFNSIKTKLLLQ